MTSSLLELACRTAIEAGALLLERFGGEAHGVGSKSSGTDMVSDADRDAEALIVERILSARPDDGILGEERGGRAGTSGFRWVIDPLDGTTNYLYGLPQWAVSIACEDASGTLAGVVRDSVRDETFSASRGSGAYLNGERVHVGDAARLSDALISTGFSYLAAERAAQGDVVARVLPAVRDIRRAGAAALDLAWTACGRLDGYYESAMQPWDLAAGALLVVEAGGVVSRLPGVGPSGGGVVAAPPQLHDALRALALG
ncbi:MAG: inositol monophosphatase family protein [Actinomycetota bacterium]|nr:inositol monophosphatase [Actinomycetota bacterium]